MEIFIIVPVWLYFWLTGWRVARLLGFAGFFFILVVVNDRYLPATGALPAAIVLLASAAVLAWLGSGLPIYTRNIMARKAADNATGSGSGRALSFY